MADEGVLPCHDAVGHYRFPARGEAPAAGPEGFVEDAAVLDFGEVDDAICFIVTSASVVQKYKESNGKKGSVGIPGLISMSSGSIGSFRASAISLGKGSVERPWKD